MDCRARREKWRSIVLLLRYISSRTILRLSKPMHAYIYRIQTSGDTHDVYRQHLPHRIAGSTVGTDTDRQSNAKSNKEFQGLKGKETIAAAVGKKRIYNPAYQMHLHLAFPSFPVSGSPGMSGDNARHGLVNNGGHCPRLNSAACLSVHSEDLQQLLC